MSFHKFLSADCFHEVPTIYTATILTVYFIGTALGSFVGGILIATTTWRWVFLINLSVGAVTLILFFIFPHINNYKELKFDRKVKRIDFIGSMTIMASSVLRLFALTYAGSRYD